MKQCSKCKEVKALSEFNKCTKTKCGLRADCKQCQYAIQMKRYHFEQHKLRAKWQAKEAKKRGILEERIICEKCAAIERLDMHHPDYQKPLKVIWLCRKCHSRIHAAS